MEFDITEIDKKLLIRALFAYSAPVGIGVAEYAIRKARKENVDGLSDEDCNEILFDFNQIEKGNMRVLDYLKGKPMKLDLIKKTNGRILTNSAAYDARNGRFRFLEAMLDTFSADEIMIVKKGYPEFNFSGQAENLKRPKANEKMFRAVIKNTIKKESKYGKYWAINENEKDYMSPIEKLIRE